MFSAPRAEEPTRGTRLGTLRTHCATAARQWGHVRVSNLPERFGNWRTVYLRKNRWLKSWVRDRGFEPLQRQQRIRVRTEVMGPDRTHIKVHPDGCAKNGAQCIGQSRGGGNTPLPRMAGEARTAVAFRLSPGPRAYEDEETRTLASHLEFQPVVPPKRNRILLEIRSDTVSATQRSRAPVPVDQGILSGILTL